MTDHPAGATLHLGGDAWAHPDLEPMLRPIEEVIAYPGNARRGDVPAIVESVRVNGVFRPIYVQKSTGYSLAGNHTRLALLELGATRAPLVVLDVDDTHARRILLADNRTAELGSYDDELLSGLLQSLGDEDGALLGTGFDDDAAAALAASLEDDLPDDPEDSNRALTTGEMLALADVTFGDPKHKPHHGDVWQLGKHTLVIAKVSDEHHLWAKHLTPGHVFCPYPEPFLTCSTLAEQRPMLLVQPNVFLAGHLLDKHATAHPDEEVVGP